MEHQVVYDEPVEYDQIEMGRIMGLTEQPRMRFAALPTPLHLAENLTREVRGPKIYLKRDDLTGLALGGNKTRKLEYLVADAKKSGATHLITVGAAQSNHARQTAAAAQIAGMNCSLVLYSSGPEPDVQGNLLLDRLLGADVHVVASRDELDARVVEVAADLRDKGAMPYTIPSGGSNGVGALGYVGAMLEMSHQLWEAGITPKAMYFAAGGGGTQGGIVLGAKLYGLSMDVIGISVSADTTTATSRVHQVVEESTQRLAVANTITDSDITIDDQHIGDGYGIPTEEGVEAIRLLARTEGVLIDPVYTSKAFAGMLADIRSDRYSPEDTIIFLHTGGAPALFAQRDLLAAALS